MPKKIVISSACLLILISTAYATSAITDAQRQSIDQKKQQITSSITPEQKQAIDQKRQEIEDKINQNYDAFKAALLKRIDRAIAMIDNTTQKISSNTKIVDSSKEVILTSLANTKKGLETYKSKASSSTSLDELGAVGREFIQCLGASGDVIKENTKKALTVLGTNMTAKAEAYKAKLMQTLEVLKKTCPSEATAIGNLENKLKDLDKEITALKQATKDQNSAQIKIITAQIKTTVKETATILQSLQGKCQL